MIKEHLQLTPGDRAELEQLVARHNVALKVWRRAVGLLALDEGATLQEAARRAGVTSNSVSAWRERYQEQGLGALQDAPRSGRPTTFDGLERAKITALACSSAPEGHARWSLSLLADKAVELGLVPSISRDRVGVILKKTQCNRT